MEISTAIIQFVGIVLFSATVEDDAGVKAIIPRIGDSEDGTQISFVDDDIEPHKAVIFYRTEDRLHRVGGWRADTVLDNGWEYVELDGEYVQFITDRRNGDPAAPPVNLPGLARTSCTKALIPPTLAPEFLPKSGYKGAVGLIDLAGGRLEACLMDPGGRADTRLLFDTRNVLIITAEKPGERAKTISLDADAVVYVVNVPPSYLSDDPMDPDPHASHGTYEPHWTAYNDMLGGTCSDEPQSDPPLVVGCHDTYLTAAYEEARNNPPTHALGFVIDAQCSNSQWP